MILPGVLAAGSAVLADPVQVQRAGVNFSSDGIISLSGAPTTGSTLVAFAYGPDGLLAAPSGFTMLDEGYTGGSGWMLAAKVSAGTETTITFTEADRIEYQEWTGLAGLGSLYDGTNSLENLGTGTSWNPAAVTADQDRAVYLAAIGLGNTSGTVTSDWADTDATYNTSLILGGYKIVTDGSAFDTAVTWTTSRPIRGGVFVLRGES